ncbi:MAG TPA: serine hydrolase [Thermoanaerobaculia bacterium]|jgi:CubicO group peptidase (beta-lactamase class C family)
MDSEVLAKAIDYARQRGIPIHSFLIVRNGYIVLDAYFYPFKDGELHDAASMTKSVTATLIGIAVGKRMLANDQPVVSVFANRNIRNLDERKLRMTVQHLLTMTSGLDCHADHAEITLRQMDQSKDWLQFMLDLQMTDEPGSKFEYCSGGMHLLSGIISQVTHTSALEFARARLALTASRGSHRAAGMAHPSHCGAGGKRTTRSFLTTMKLRTSTAITSG